MSSPPPRDTPELIDPVEDCTWLPPRELLARHGYTPLPPSELDDRQLPGRLWEWLYAAAAARRLFFHNTNHLSDREFYTLLWDEWQDEPTADIPLEAETDTRISVSEFAARGMTPEEVWLRYYADEDDQKLWHSTDPGFVFPPHENPPYDRDRFLPTPPFPLAAHAGWIPGDDDVSEESTDDADPLGLAEVDRGIAAAEAEADPEAPPFDPPDPAVEAKLSAMEPENWTPPAKELGKKNIPLIPPAEIMDESLTSTLWELLHNLSLCGYYVLNTNHLSDREVYAALWEHGLRDPAYLPGRNPRGGFFHDFTGSGDEEDTKLWLRYYASDEIRASHAEEWPEEVLPPKEKPQFNRDWRLPKGPF